MTINLSASEMERYSRTILLNEIDFQGQLNLKSSSVLVIGCGGIGCHLITSLVAAGIGSVGFVDFDFLEISNLQRQSWYKTSEIGQKKGELLQKQCKDINPNVTSQYHDLKISNSPESVNLLGKYDIIIDTSDNLTTRLVVNQLAYQLGKPLFCASAIGFSGQVCAFFGKPCYACLFGHITDKVENCSNAGVVSSVPMISASLVCTEVVKYIAGVSKEMIGKIYNFNTVKGIEISQHTVTHNHECKVCG